MKKKKNMMMRDWRRTKKLKRLSPTGLQNYKLLLELRKKDHKMQHEKFSIRNAN